MSTGAKSDVLYLLLRGAREHLCEAQAMLVDKRQRDLLGEAIDRVDSVGVFLPQWSTFDWPEIPS